METYPNDRLNAFALPYLGEIALSNGDVAAAAGYFRKGLKLFPEGRLQDDCRLGLAQALEQQNQTKEAERLYLAVANKPACPVADAAQFHLGALQYACRQIRRGDEEFLGLRGSVREESLAAQCAAGQRNGVVEVASAGRCDEAVRRRVGDSRDRRRCCSSKRCEARSKRICRGKTTPRSIARRHNSRNSFPRASLQATCGECLPDRFVERKEYAKALALLDALIGANPTRQLEQPGLENRYLLAVCYEGLKRYEDALAAILPVVDNAKGQLKTDAQSTHGTLLLALKKYAEAIAPLEAFLAEKPTGDAEAKALGQLAICYARADQLDKAKKLYADLLEKYPGHALIAPTVERLAEAAYDANDAAWAAELSGQLVASALRLNTNSRASSTSGGASSRPGNCPRPTPPSMSFSKRIRPMRLPPKRP